MSGKRLYNVFVGLLLACLVPGWLCANELNALFERVENLNINWHGYVLGAVLTDAQLKIARAHPEVAAAQDTFKFRDRNLCVVAHKTSRRVLILYEQLDRANQQKIQDLVGELVLAFDDPTFLAHDRVIYWAYAEKGKISSMEFDRTKQAEIPLDILAVVKCISDIPFMDKGAAATPGHAYYTISSQPVLKQFIKEN